VKLKDIKFLAFLLCFFLLACPEKKKPKKKYLTIISEKNIFKEEDSSKKSMVLALDRQIVLFKNIINKKVDRKWRFEDMEYTTAEMLSSLEKFKEIYISSKNIKEMEKRLRKFFDFYKFEGIGNDKQSEKKEKVLITGYYTPLLKASREKTKRFKYPIYKLPDDLLKIDLSKFGISPKNRLVGRLNLKRREIVPYYTREAIDWKGAISGKGLEIAYLDTYMDQFFLHIQGGGILESYNATKKKNEMIYVNYAGKNGKEYLSIGRSLIHDNKISKDRMSLQAIRDYFKKNPDELKKYVIQNESYVFYKEGTAGPYGSLGLVVTPKRSIATDKRFFSGGGIAFVSGKYRTGGKNKIRRFVVDQDTGGAIRKNHIDLYCGVGREAEEVAGYMKERGQVIFLLPKKRLGM